MCVCVIVVTMRGWADVGLWVAVCFLAKISLHRPKTTFSRLTQSQAISQSIAFSSLSDQWDIRTRFTFFYFSKLFLIQNYRVLYHGDQKRSPGGESAGGGRSTLNSTCVVPAWTLTAFGDRPASSMSKFSASVNSDLGNGSCWLEIRDAEHVDRCSWKYTRVWSYQLTSDLRDVYFFGNACNGRVWRQFRCPRLS